MAAHPADQPSSIRDYSRFSVLQDRLSRLRKLIRKPSEQVIPWIGAGMSVGDGFPTWGGFLSGLIKRLSNEEDRVCANHLMSRDLFDLAADFIDSRAATDLRGEMVRCFGNSPMHATLRNRLASLLCTQWVTLNYDRVLEQTISGLLPLTPTSYRAGIYSSKPCVIKLHGTIELEDSWVLTRSQYVRTYTQEFWSFLESLIRSHTILFMGCSLHSTDAFLRVFGQIPEKERKEHFAILAVKTSEEGTSRGEELKKIGIDVLPYIPNAGHSFIDEFLDSVRPTISDAINRLEWLAAQHDFEKVRFILSISMLPTQVAPADAEAFAKTVAKVIRSAVGREIATAEAIAKIGVTLLPNSADVLAAAIDAHEQMGKETSELKVKLRRLMAGPVKRRNPKISSSKDNNVKGFYEAYRRGDHSAMQVTLDVLKSRGEIDMDRYAFHSARRALLAGRFNEALPYIKVASPLASHFTEATVFFHQRRFADALCSLEKCDKTWRSANDKNSRGLPFSLLLRARCSVGLKKYGDVEYCVGRARLAYDPLPVQARRALRRRLTSEFSLDLRRLGSDELAIVLEFWRIVGMTVPEDSEACDDARALYETLRGQTDDILLSWYSFIIEEILADGGTSVRESHFNTRLESLQSHAPGYVAEVAIAYAAAAKRYRNDALRGHTKILGQIWEAQLQLHLSH